MIDAHAHITSPEMLPDVEGVIERALSAGLKKIVNICTDEKSLVAGLALQEQFSCIVNTAATTPHDVEKEGEAFFPLVEKAAREKKLVAIGETGLDYYYEHLPKKRQQEFLHRYFALGHKVDLPIIFHCREAFADLFSIADNEWKGRPAVLHCFTGTKEEARGVLDRGWFLSISGIVTYKRSEDLRDVVKYVPLERLLIETDSPYLAPQAKRGKQNEPSYLPEIAREIARVKNLSTEEVGSQSAKNARQFFHLQ